ncbi:MAG: hypothetical protein HYZ50_22795 [Deltaproteobacteria bacterium]|nr:hypothetical protein [Deltaproteobacteria bacterium]
MLPQLEALLRASAKVVSFQVLDNDPFEGDQLLFKIRCKLASGNSLQIRIRADADMLRYSYQEFTDKPLQRWDNAPHFSHLVTAPHHHHNLHGNVVESSLTGDPIKDLPLVLNMV